MMTSTVFPISGLTEIVRVVIIAQPEVKHLLLPKHKNFHSTNMIICTDAKNKNEMFV